MKLLIALLILLVLFGGASFPYGERPGGAWDHDWGYTPSGISLVLAGVIVLALLHIL